MRSFPARVSTVSQSPPEPEMVPRNRFDWPRKFATNTLDGFSYNCTGAPSCSTCPAFITAIVSAIVMASS